MKRNAIFQMFVCSLFMAVLSHGTVWSQGMRVSPEERANALKDSLGLDAKQTEQVTAIYKKSSDQMRSMFQSGSGDREAMRGKMQEMTKKTDEEVMKLLNDSQKKKYEEMVKNRPARGNFQRRRNN